MQSQPSPGLKYLSVKRKDTFVVSSRHSAATELDSNTANCIGLTPHASRVWMYCPMSRTDEYTPPPPAALMISFG
ncbi:MAG: hypothetical protein BWY59_00158 [Verrucomicrobia bacterium ADurb.Bin345]|nr:MAG: hypothetical protein BWY59_00158 [Verrucomicrobia bacterium ADurb.Bin345]